MNEDEHFSPIPDEETLEIEPGSLIAIRREDARYKIALYYVCGFILIFFYAMTIAFINKMQTSELTDLLVSISGILSGPLGFIIGYYFKSSTDESG
jgi:hypothetical protein